MEGENSASCAYRPRMEAEDPSSGPTVQTLGPPSIGDSESVHKVDDSQLVGAPADYVVGGGKDSSAAVVETNMEAMVEASGVVKRKRGRPPRGQAKPPPPKMKKDEEDVCFICFDGGSLVLCDRRDCPKAYHPACIKRDEAFFRSKAKWNCGWHICTSCQKAAYFMCYTCPFSLCKGCTKDADYVCVRGNKGFCGTCLRTIMLIENNEHRNKEMVQVDFDDTSSWEYLFKVYWVYLKGKLLLTSNELTQAKNPWKAADGIMYKGQSTEVKNTRVYDGQGSFSDSSPGCLEVSKRRKTNEHPEYLQKDNQSTDKSAGEQVTASGGCTEWASRELLEFVALMKNGDTSVLSQFDVQSLLLDYIKQNNLRDPRRKSQVICDSRLRTLFRKARVGHFEMLKLLEFHFLSKEESHKNVLTQSNIVGGIAVQVEADRNNDDLFKVDRNKRDRNCKKAGERGLPADLDEYAAIDVHNINLIYLRRNLMERLIEDIERFLDKVVGSIVRIRISSNDQKQDIYRLVQVVGTRKAALPYKVGKITADVMLEILNLDKKEAISIDAISDQEFSEDECRRLRQSIKCGLVKRLTVGDILKKAMALQAVRVDDWLETEILRLNHLRDRASEKGHKKGLRECVEKLQLLKTPEERQRRLHEIPEVHGDSHMDPNYESEDGAVEPNNKKQDEHGRTRSAGANGNAKGPNSPWKRGDFSNDSRGRRKNITTSEPKEYTPGTLYPVKVLGSTWKKPGNQVGSTCSLIGSCNDQAGSSIRLVPEVASDTSTAPFSAKMAPTVTDSEMDKLWHYLDPNGKIQGPFCMLQLRKWSTTGYFPLDLRIWRIDSNQDKSVLLTDALSGKSCKASSSSQGISLESQESGGASNGGIYNCDVRWTRIMSITGDDSKAIEGAQNSNKSKAHIDVNNEFVSSNTWDSHSADEPRPDVNCKNEEAGNFSQCLDSKNTTHSHQSQLHDPVLSSTSIRPQHGSPSRHGRGSEEERWNSDPNADSWNSRGTLASQAVSRRSHENLSNIQAIDSFQRKQDTIPNMPSPTPKGTDRDLEGQITENNQSVSLNVVEQESHIPDLPSPTPLGNEEGGDLAAKNNQSVSSSSPVQDSGPSGSNASSLEAGNRAPLPEIADEWGGYSPTPSKPSVGELESTLVSSCSVKPPEVVTDHAAALTANGGQLTHSSPSNPVSNASVWLIGEAIDFSTLEEESVSDLLAEVDAMESQCGLGSPTSVMNCGEDMIDGARNDLFCLVEGLEALEGLSPKTDPGKTNDAFSSTADAQLPSQLIMTDAPHGASGADDVLDPPIGSSGQSSTSSEVEGGKDPSVVPGEHCEAGSDILPPAPSPTSQKTQDMVDMDYPSRAENNGCENLPGQKVGLGGLAQEITSTVKGTDSGTAWAVANVNPSASEATGGCENQTSRAVNNGCENLLGQKVSLGGLAQEITNTVKGTDRGTARAIANVNPSASEATVGCENQTSRAVNNGCENLPGQKVGLGGLAQEITNTVKGADRGTARVIANVNPSASEASVGCENQTKYSGERTNGPRDLAVRVGNQGTRGGKNSWSSNPSFGGGGHPRPSYGQRVCKFYERGYCRKGASCGYLHPRR